MDSAELIKRIRKQMGWNQDELGSFLGVGKSQISNIENGLNDFPATKLLRLLDAAGWTLTPPSWALEAEAARERAERLAAC